LLPVRIWIAKKGKGDEAIKGGLFRKKRTTQKEPIQDLAERSGNSQQKRKKGKGWFGLPQGGKKRGSSWFNPEGRREENSKGKKVFLTTPKKGKTGFEGATTTQSEGRGNADGEKVLCRRKGG